MCRVIIFILLFTTSFSAMAQTWSRVGTGADGPVYSLVAFQDGLSVGGSFKQINSFNRINHCLIRENYADNYSYFFTYAEDFNTSAMDSGTLSSVIRCALPAGNNLHVGGQFLHPDYDFNVGLGVIVGGTSTEFEGYNAQAETGETIFCMAQFDDQIFFGGEFSDINGAKNIGHINLQSNRPYVVEPAGNNLEGPVYSLENFNGILCAGGDFSISDTDTVVVCNIARWDNGTWECLGPGVNGPVMAMDVFDDKLVLGGAFAQSDSNQLHGIATWDGTSFAPMGIGFSDSTDTVFAIGSYSDTLFVGGRILDSSSGNAQNLYQWNATNWDRVGSGINGPVHALESYRGRLYIGGSFSKADALISRNIVAYNNGKEALGVGNHALGSKSKIWPNPTRDRIEISSNMVVTSIRLLAIDGRLIHTQEGDIKEISIKSLGLHKGSYILSIHYGNETIQNERILVY